MRYRVYPRTGWELSEVGYGMWGLGGWTGSDDEQTLQALTEAVSLGCNFFDTAWAYGAGHSERLLAQTLRAHRGTRLYVATKVPPKNQRWIQLEDSSLDEVFPPDHIRRYTEESLANLGVEAIDVQQFHAWSDRWARDDRWQRTIDDLTREGLVRSWGISVNRWETTNVLEALRTGLIDCVQVVYNIFDQDPEDELFPLLPGARHCRHCARAVRRGQPHRDAHAGFAVAARRLAQPVLHSAAAGGDARANRTPARDSALRHGAGGAGAALHPAPSCRHDHHSRDAAARERSRQLQCQRRTSARPGVAGVAAATPLDAGLGGSVMRCVVSSTPTTTSVGRGFSPASGISQRTWRDLKVAPYAVNG